MTIIRREDILKSQSRTEFKFIISVVLRKPDPHHLDGQRVETWITTSARANVPEGMDRSDFYRQFATQSLGKAITDAATTFPGYAYVSHAIVEVEDL